MTTISPRFRDPQPISRFSGRYPCRTCRHSRIRSLSPVTLPHCNGCISLTALNLISAEGTQPTFNAISHGSSLPLRTCACPVWRTRTPRKSCRQLRRACLIVRTCSSASKAHCRTALARQPAMRPRMHRVNLPCRRCPTYGVSACNRSFTTFCGSQRCGSCGTPSEVTMPGPCATRTVWTQAANMRACRLSRGRPTVSRWQWRIGWIL